MGHLARLASGMAALALTAGWASAQAWFGAPAKLKGPPPPGR